MKLDTGKLLASLRLGSKAIAILQLGSTSLRYGLGRSGNGGLDVSEFTFGDDSGWGDPRQLGLAFRAHLDAAGVAVRRVETVVLPCDWTLLRSRKLPPATDPALISGMVATASEEAFAERSESLACAYQLSSAGGEVAVSLFGCGRDQLASVKTFLQAAGLSARRVVPGPAALALALDQGEHLVLLQENAGLTLLTTADGRATWQRSVPGCSDGGDEEVAAHLRRAALVMPVGASVPLTLVGNGLAQASAAVLLAAANSADSSRPVKKLGVDEVVEALAASQQSLRDSRLDLQSERRADRPRLRQAIRVGSLVGAVLLILVVWLAVSWIGARQSIAQTRAALDELAPQVSRARQMRQLIHRTDPWHDANPGYLDAIMALTEKFPEEGSIWLMGLDINEAGEITLSGQARRREDVLALLAAIESEPTLSHVDLHFIRQQSGRETIATFSVSCRYQRGAKP
jgi:Tfp pilus assembly protein PilN